MSLQIQPVSTFQLYRLLLKEYYTQEVPLRLVDVTSHFFPFTAPFWERVIGCFKGKQFELLTLETLKEEKWAPLNQTIQQVKKMFGLEDEILIAKDLSAKIHSYAITGNIIIVNEETAFSFTQEGQAFAIAHELSHYSHGHLNKRTYLNLVWIVIDLSFLSLAHYRSRLYLVAFVLAEIGIFHLDQAVSRMHEKEADLTAIENLGANHGAKEFFFLNLAFNALHFLEANKIQFPRQPNIQKLISTLFKIGIALESVTPVKLALSHPTHVERLQYCCIEE